MRNAEQSVFRILFFHIFDCIKTNTITYDSNLRYRCSCRSIYFQ